MIAGMKYRAKPNLGHLRPEEPQPAPAWLLVLAAGALAIAGIVLHALLKGGF